MQALFAHKGQPLPTNIGTRSDVIVLHARTLELVDRCYQDVRVRLTRTKLQIGEEEFDPETVPHMEASGAEIVLPREAMGRTLRSRIVLTR